MLDRKMCKASEVGKIIVNKCLDLEIAINTVKLEKLLVICNVEMLRRYKKPLFNEKIIELAHGLGIKEVDMDFLKHGVLFKTKRNEYISLLDSENNVINKVISVYGRYSSFELNKIIDDVYDYKKLFLAKSKNSNMEK